VVQRSVFTHQGRRSELEDSRSTSAPMSTVLVVTSTIHPWLKMGQLPGVQVIHTISHKIASIEQASAAPAAARPGVLPLVCLHPSPTTGEMYAERQAQLVLDRRYADAGKVDLFGFHTGSLCAVEVALPTLLIACNQEMTEPTRQAAKLIAQSRLVEMPDLPIFGFIVAPQRVAATMRQFLDAQEAA
jgi:hypothetical protein